MTTRVAVARRIRCAVWQRLVDEQGALVAESTVLRHVLAIRAELDSDTSLVVVLQRRSSRGHVVAFERLGDVHHGRTEQLLDVRANVLAGAYATHPERFVNGERDRAFAAFTEPKRS